MERKGTLLNRKYRTLLVSTLSLTASMYLAGIIDAIMVGRILGTEELSAINLSLCITFLRDILVSLFTFGGNTLSVMYKGKRDNESADKVFTLSFLAGVVSAIVLAVVGILLAAPTAHILTKGGELYGYVKSFLLPLWCTGPLIALTNQTAAFARTDGMNRFSTALPIIANVINLGCDYLYMKPLNMGIAGAGWATVTGYVVSSILTIGYFKSKKRSVHFDKSSFKSMRFLKDTFSTGLPSSLIYVCNFLRLFFTNSIILGATGVMGCKIASVTFSLNSLAFIFVEGASMTMLPILGALYGEKDTKGIKITLRYGMIVTLVLCMVVFVVSELFPVQLASIYGLTDKETLGIFKVTFRILSINVPILSVVYVLRTFFQATKQRTIANILVILDGFLTVVPIMYAFSKIDIYWLWASFPVSKAATLLILLVVILVAKKKQNKKSLLLLDEEKDSVLDFSIDNEQSQASVAAKTVLAFCKDNGVDATVANAIAVNTEELCHNIASYARSDKSDTVDICVRIFADKITLRIRDNGNLFNPTEYIDDSGNIIIGLKLVRALSSAIEYNRVLDFNVTTITVNR